ncbi:helix-hairpin-helix domain-containing protein [Effusibacillus pohliae]|uniref:helix-hairpin-helix domain-containing protein n=1 Tax=Effusibacillus pohliae TaxID=232270 RepID=UPI00035D6D52|nr:helix-hairpin-helix domain-containing protein [Effusibacillus pohliae]
MLRLTKREQVIVVALLLLILLVSGVYMYGRPGMASQVPLPKAAEQPQPAASAGSKQDAAQPKPAGEVMVDVKGAVHSPGVYTLPAGARVVDAIQAAGGATEQADLQSVNLAQKLADGAPVLIPAKGEQASAAKPSVVAEGKLNLNTATIEQLDALDGIGSTRAKAIVEYREKNGPFQSVDDLLKVKGFGPKLLDAIKDRLTVY